MAEQLSLFEPPKKAYVPPPPNLPLAYKYLCSYLRRLSPARAMPYDARELAEITQRFEHYCPMMEHEGPEMLADFKEMVARLAGTDKNDETTWLPE